MIDNTCDVSELQGRSVHVHAYFVVGILHNAINNEQLYNTFRVSLLILLTVE